MELEPARHPAVPYRNSFTHALALLRFPSLALALASAVTLWLPVSLALAQGGSVPAASDFQSIATAAAAARDRNDIPQAIALYAQAVAVNPKWQDGWWFLGVLQYGSNAYAPARDALTHFIALTPEAGPAYAIRGLCEFETADYGPSLEDIERALEQGAANQNRNTGILRYHQVLLLTHAGRFEEALTASAEFSKGEAAPPIVEAVGVAGLRVPLLPQEVPNSAQALYMAAGSATLTFMSGDASKAQQAFATLFQQFPDTANAHYLYGYLLFGKEPEHAIAEFKSELTVVPNSATAESMLGWAEMIQENYPEALIHGGKAVALAPDISAGQLVLGRALVETGDPAKGLEHLKLALSMDPGSLETHLALVRAYSKTGQREDAQRERQQCLLISRGSGPHAAQP